MTSYRQTLFRRLNIPSKLSQQCNVTGSSTRTTISFPVDQIIIALNPEFESWNVGFIPLSLGDVIDVLTHGCLLLT
jgi:hypothetical protein